MTNKEISRKFSLTAKLMELHGENKFKARSYSNASFNLSRLDKPLEDMDRSEISSLKGVGDAISQKIEDLLDHGSFKLLDELTAKTPEGIMELLQIKGLGAGKLRTIWKDLGVETPGELLYACRENRLAQMKGFGEKTQQNLINSLEYYLSNKKMYHYASLEPIAEQLIKKLVMSKVAAEVRFTGAFRRRAVVLESLDFLLIEPMDDVIYNLSSLEEIHDVSEQENYIAAKSEKGVPLRFFPTSGKQCGMMWLRTTGSEAHLERLGPLPDLSEAKEEKAIYESLNHPYIIPELREGLFEFNGIDQDGIITENDIKGVIHSHSTWSDGSVSIREMAEACMEVDYEYLVMSDHSKSAFYANGLDEERLIAQMNEIDDLNASFEKEGINFKVFKSIESDILNDGSLDYGDDLLERLDLVIASVHSNLKMDEEKAMNRLIRAIEHPATRILGHMTGRLLLSRRGYPVDHSKIIDACAANNVVIEINANPMRLDIDWKYIPKAIEKGVMLSVNPDAHSIAGIDDIHFGVLAARKGGLTAKHCLNCYDLNTFEQFLQQGG